VLKIKASASVIQISSPNTARSEPNPPIYSYMYAVANPVSGNK